MTEKKRKKKEAKAVSPPKNRTRKKSRERVHLIRLDNSLFGIRRDEFIDMSEENRIHRIPLTPDYFAGITNVDGITTSVFDLAKFVHVQSVDPLNKSLLIVSREKPAAAFAIDEILKEENINEKDCFQLPACLKNGLIDSAVAVKDTLVPVINLKSLYKGLLSNKWQEEAPSLELPENSKKTKKSASGRVTCFKAAGEEYAAIDIEEVMPLASLKVTPLPFLPDFVAGISLHKGRLMTIIDACQRITGKKAEEKGTLIARHIGDDLYAFKTDRVQKSSKKGYEKKAKLPLVAEKPWMQNILLIGKALIPLVELDSLPGPVKEERSLSSLAHSYHPEKSTASRFGKKEMEVRDFLISGRRYSIPSTQIKDVIAFSPGRNLPLLPSIITGVQEHKGQIIPIVDIATCFGFRSRPDKGWKMILLENGDFSAFVLAQMVFDDHLLEADQLKQVPVVMKHRFLYGCYTNEKSKGVSLILNIFKLCIYFDEKSAQQIFKSIDKETNTSLPSKTEAGKPEVSPETSADRNDQVGDPPREEVIPATEMTGEKTALEDDNRMATLHGNKAPLMEQLTGKTPSGEGEGENEEIDNKKSSTPFHVEKPFHDRGEEDIPIEERVEEKEDFPEEPGEIANSAIPASYQPEDETTIASRSVYDSANRAGKIILILIFIVGGLFYFLFRSGDNSAVNPLTEKKFPASIESPKPITRDVIMEKEEVAPLVTEKSPPKNASAEASLKSEDKSKNEAFPTSRPRPGKTQSLSAGDQKNSFHPVKERTAPKENEKKFLKPIIRKGRIYPPLGEFDYYTVREGDTLWDIAEAYSKNPYDYYLVAEDNRIIDPDLIYPGQKLRMQKKWKEKEAEAPAAE